MGLTNLQHAVACNNFDEPETLSARQQRAKAAWVRLYSMRFFVDNWVQKVGHFLAHPRDPRPPQDTNSHIQAQVLERMPRAGLRSVTKTVIPTGFQMGLTTKV